MSYWPAGFDPRSDTARVLQLCRVSTPDGPARFILGTDGKFTDVDGDEWVGSQLLGVGDTEIGIGSAAPSGSLTLSFFQDPDAPDLVAQIRDLGADYIAGYKIRFYDQPFNSLSEMYAPVFSPVLKLTRIMRQITFSAAGPMDRSISVSFESAAEIRNTARRLIYNADDYALLLGASNPSLDYIPSDEFQEEKLW